MAMKSLQEPAGNLFRPQEARVAGEAFNAPAATPRALRYCEVEQSWEYVTGDENPCWDEDMDEG